MRESTIYREASSSFCSARASDQGPPYPTLRANPFPEVTDLFCRLPLPTLFYWPEAANLGDLMRLWVRPGVQTKCTYSFSRTDEGTPNTSKHKVLCPHKTLAPGNLFSGCYMVKKKRKRFPRPPPASPDLFMLPSHIHTLAGEY